MKVYDSNGIQIYCDRQESILPILASDSIDLLFTDMPYGTTRLSWDKRPNLADFWRRSRRVCKPHAIQALFGVQPFVTDLINSNRKHYRYELIWPKTAATGFLDANRRPLRGHENIQIFADRPGKSTYNPQKIPGDPYGNKGKRTMRHMFGEFDGSSDIRASNAGDRFPTSILPAFKKGPIDRKHETGKPMDLLLWIIETYTHPGDLVLDPFVGFGSAAEACAILDRRFIGIDIREEATTATADRLRARA